MYDEQIVFSILTDIEHAIFADTAGINIRQMKLNL